MQKKTYHIVYTAIFAVLMAICSWISIPTVIPFTLQTFAVFLMLLVLGGKLGTCAIFIYLLLGLIGIPVFSHFGAGPGVLFGNTGGFLLGFIFTGLMMCFTDKLFGRKMIVQLISLLLGLLLCYLFGTLWFLYVTAGSGTEVTFSAAFGICVIPFIVPDLLKLVMAYFFSKRLSSVLAFRQ